MAESRLRTHDDFDAGRPSSDAREGASVYLFTAGTLLASLTLMEASAVLSFALGRSLSIAHFPFALAGSIAFICGAARVWPRVGSVRACLGSAAAVLLIWLVSLMAAALTYDLSWDGQTYHQEAVIRLKEGWNPVRSYLDPGAFRELELNHYPKGAEIVGAEIYASTGSIQAGKSTTIVLMVATFLLGFELLRLRLGWDRWKAALVSGLLALNPVAVVQAFTFYVDGQLASLLGGLVVTLALLCFEASPMILASLSFILIIGANTKDTAVGYSGVFVSGCLAALLWCRRFTIARAIACTAGASWCVGVLLIGYNPYVTNTLQDRNPLFPFGRGSKFDVVTYNEPRVFRGLGRVQKLAISLRSHTEDLNSQSTHGPEIRSPFAFTRADVRNSAKFDIRIAGFGFLFQEILIVTGVGWLLLVALKRLKRTAWVWITYASAILAGSVLIMPEAWWARYVPQIWLFPLVVLVGLQRAKANATRLTAALIGLLMLANTGVISLLSLRNELAGTVAVRRQLSEFKRATGTIRVDFGLFRPIRKRLEESGIKYIEEVIGEETDATQIVGSFGRSRAIVDRRQEH